LSLWDSYDLSRFELRAGNFSEDSRGRWYLNVCGVCEAVHDRNVNAAHNILAAGDRRLAEEILVP
jgi:transposase